MSMPRRAALQAGLLMLVAMFANAASRNTIRIKVLDSETRSVSSDDNNGVPLNCDELTFDAYCRSTRNATATLVNTVLVQEGNGTPFRITCTADSRGSKCIHLPIGETFDARKDKHGITVYYLDDKGKGQSQLYSLVAGTAKAKPAAVAMVPVAKAPASAAPAENRAPVPTPSTAPVPAASVSLTAAPVQNSSATAPAPEPAPAQGGLPEKGLSEKVRCNFRSTPSGADITVDGRYVGNTPSEIGLSTGAHVVVLSMSGFAQWKRELTVEADSVVNVTASLQKTQP